MGRISELLAGLCFVLRETRCDQIECLAQRRNDRAGRAVTKPAIHNSSDNRSHHGRRHLRVHVFYAPCAGTLGDDIGQLNLCHCGCLENLALNRRLGKDEPNPLQPSAGLLQRFTFLRWRLKLRSYGICDRRPQRLTGGTTA